MWNELLREKNVSVYQVSKQSGIPYSTVLDIFSGKTKLEKCSVGTLHAIADFFNMSMDDIYEMDKAYNISLMDFEVFKGNVQHRLKEQGSIDFLIETIKADEVSQFWRMQRYANAFYMLAMIDYLSKKNNIPLCTKYDNYRKQKLQNKLYPVSTIVESKLLKKDIDECVENPIPEFLQYNIVEGDIFNVV